MEVEFKDNICDNGVKDVFIRDDKKTLKIFYGLNGDLYFDIFGARNRDKYGICTATFSINQNEEIYQYFEQLISSIIDCKVFDMSEIELELFNSINDITSNMNSIQKRNEDLKTEQAYKKLVHNDTIIWRSDNIYDESANILQIKKDGEEIKLTFIDNPDDPSFGFATRICNSGSKYNPFNLCFMNFFNQLQLMAKKDSTKKLMKTM